MRPSPAQARAGGAAGALVALLCQLEGVLKELDDSEYRCERAKGVSGSIGGHVRHLLDHVNALFPALAGRAVNYDTRCRGTDVEHRVDAALSAIDDACQRLAQLTDEELGRSVSLSIAVSTTGSSIETTSTFERELAFVVSHTVHHFAIIALLLREAGEEVPPRFGYAPTTPDTRAA
jgi:uncharacterized damage-inducible protein DinB